MSESGQDGGSLPQYKVNKTFADRRFKVQSARTYFYLNEATCERNTEIFIRCLESVAGLFKHADFYFIKQKFYCVYSIEFFFILGATFGTGIMAIKVTALGRPQLLVRYYFCYCNIIF